MAPATTQQETRRGFSATAAVYAVTMAGGTLPIPLWHTWSRSIGFGPFVTTVAFAAYAVGTVVALTLFSRTSDQVGRRPVLLVGLACAAVSSALLLVAADVSTILLARLLSGLGAGLTTATASASLSELAGRSRVRLAATTATLVNIGGLGAGIVLAAGVLQVAGEDTTAIRWLYAGHLAAVAAAALSLPRIFETVPRASRRHVRWAVSRPTLPSAPADRARFGWAAAGVFVAFAVTGLFSSLVPDFLREDVHLTAPLPAGLIVASLFAAALLAQLLAPARLLESRWTASVALAGGTALYECGLLAERLSLFVVGTLVAGAGFGLVFRRGLQITQRVAAHGRRADQLATYFLCAYAGNVIPTLALGAVSELAGDRAGSVGLASAVAAGALATGAGAHRTRRAAAPAGEVPTESLIADGRRSRRASL